MKMQGKKTGRKPPAYATCDASTGVDYEGVSPTVKVCGRRATVEWVGLNVVGETWFCDEHSRAREETDAILADPVWNKRLTESLEQSKRGQTRPLSEYLAEGEAEDV